MNNVLDCVELKKHFPVGKGALLHAVDDVSFAIGQGESVGVPADAPRLLVGVAPPGAPGGRGKGGLSRRLGHRHGALALRALRLPPRGTLSSWWAAGRSSGPTFERIGPRRLCLRRWRP